MILLVIFIVLAIYLFFILLLLFGFYKVPVFITSAIKPITKFSIIVPFRNEAENLPKLLASFDKLNYPTSLFDVILVDDASDNHFESGDFNYKISIIKSFRTSNSPKKDAILTAIKIINNEWIITTDADCEVHSEWLITLDNHIQNNNFEMVAGAVTYNINKSFLHHFQQLDLASLQGATIGSFGLNKGFMCNGANFAYKKSFFEMLNGFEGNENIASGDDVFLMQKAMAQFPQKVSYLKSYCNIVNTKPLDNWKDLFFQRVRWASKTTSYNSSFGKILGIVVFSGNTALLFTLGYWFCGKIHLLYLLLSLALKFVTDALLIFATNKFLKTKTKYLILATILYPFFAVTVALYCVVGRYEWKGRTFKK